MATTLLLASVLLGGPQAKVPMPTPETIQPDVLLTRPEEAFYAEKALNEHKLDTAKLLFLTARKPVVACYGRLTEEAHASASRSSTIASLLMDKETPAWSQERVGSVRKLMQNSEFRDMIRINAHDGYKESLRFTRATSLAYRLPSGYYLQTPPVQEGLQEGVELPEELMRLADLQPLSPVLDRAPAKSQDAVACVVPFGTSANDRLPFMMAGIKALAGRRSEDIDRIARTMPKAPSLEITADERTRALSCFADRYKDLGFGSRSEALRSLRPESLIKFSSVMAWVDSDKGNEHRPTVGWTLVNL